MLQCICYDVEEDVLLRCINGLKCTIEIELTSGFLSVLAPKIRVRTGQGRPEVSSHEAEVCGHIPKGYV